MNSQNSGSFFDGRTMVAILVGILFMVGWQSYLKNKYPAAYKDPKTNQVQSEKSVSTGQERSAEQVVSAGKVQSEEKSQTKLSGDPSTAAAGGITSESLYDYEDRNFKLQVSSYGLAIKNVHLKKEQGRDWGHISFAKDADTNLFATALVGRRNPIVFDVERVSENQFKGTSNINGMKVVKILSFEPGTFSVKTNIKVEGTNDEFLGLSTNFSELVHEHHSGFSLIPKFEFQEFVVLHDGSTSHVRINPDKDLSESYAATHVAGLSSQYFTSVLVDNSDVIPEFKASMSSQDKRARGILTYPALKAGNNMTIEYTAFIGPKAFEILQSVDKDLTAIINFGWFPSIGKMMKNLMTIIHGPITNWGLVIILLTIIIRVIVLPFNMMSYRQMKAMQVIQPQMNILRERYKNDPQRMNQEVMKLWKEAKANPLGGCLPMLLQIPIFFALYSVIGQSIELYQEPFGLWISDLSKPDPYFVLPILMSAVMFIQQKMTPSTMDPAQQKIMLFMPVLFSVMMITLPSGLTLYMFISALFGFLQQMYFLRDNNKQAISA